jgi:HD superfamily phosphohydrolase YqeK
LSEALPELSPLVGAAARGDLPGWACAGAHRREHMSRVAALLATWAEELGLDQRDRERWLAVGWLHDVLRDAPGEALRPEVPPDLSDLPAAVLHGPAAAERLRGDTDDEMLQAIRYHTIGHPSLGTLGRALYLADFLEPGRTFEVSWREALRERMPEDLREVLVEVLAARIRHLIDARKPVRPETAAFWSALARGR